MSSDLRGSKRCFTRRMVGCAALFSAAASLGLASIAGAQGDPNNPPAGGNPPAQGGQPQPGQRPNFRNMTPEQRQQFMQQRRAQFREQTLRRSLDAAGFTGAPQDTVVAFGKAHDQAAQSLQDLSQKLVVAISTPGTSDADIATLLTSFRTAVANEKARRKTAEAALDAQVNYSKQPRLAAVLTTMGLIGDEMTVLDSSSGGIMGGGGGFGGRGGGGGFGGGGGRGGRGGRGGGGQGGQGGGAGGGNQGGGGPGPAAGPGAAAA